MCKDLSDYELSEGRLLFCVFLSFGVSDDAGMSFAGTAGLGCGVGRGVGRLTPLTLELDGVAWCLPLTCGTTSWTLETAVWFEETGSRQLATGSLH
jgi:hypothetical protein